MKSANALHKPVPSPGCQKRPSAAEVRIMIGTRVSRSLKHRHGSFGRAFGSWSSGLGVRILELVWSASTLQEPQIEGREHQDHADVHHQPFPEPVPEEQDINADHDGDQREHVKHRDCLPSHLEFLGHAA